LATLPLAIAAFVLLAALPGYDWPLGPDVGKYLVLMAILGLCASWLGTLFWNQTSRLLPTALSGQMIVFETIFGMAFAFGLRGEWPNSPIVAGLAFLILGVVLGVRATRRDT
jgi:drug/metabolite transporter (DMT)-like permease